MGLVVGLATTVFVADQLTKVWALARLDPTHPVVVIPDLLHLALVMNPGVAFGIFAGVPPEWRWIVTLFSLTALALLGSLAFRILPRGNLTSRVAIGLVFGGAAGNLVDRWRHGAVVDFIDVFWRTYHWPAFNVADSAISIGVVLLALRLLRDRPPAPSG
jgi:signal peptidase II